MRFFEGATSFLPNFSYKTTSVAKSITTCINLITSFGEFRRPQGVCRDAARHVSTPRRHSNAKPCSIAEKQIKKSR
jgi:hypothetical protein